MNANYNDYYQRKTTCTFIYILKAKKCETFYIQKARHLTKSKKICVTFLIQKSWRFTLRNFSWKFWNWHLYTKSMTLCVTWSFYIQKVRHFTKSKTICVTFLCTKSLTLCVTRFFMEISKLAEGGGIFICQKQCTLGNIFICKKQCTLRYVFISKIYLIVLIPNYELTYNQSDQINK